MSARWWPVMLFGALAVGSARAQSPVIESWFDIPAQPVASALGAYSAATGRLAAYNGNLAVGRVSSPVKGRLTAAAALQLLLNDTGLLARDTTEEAFVVVLDDRLAGVMPTNIAQNALSQQSHDQRRYSGILQAAISHALCARSETAPGAYRLAISFRVSELGDLAKLRLLSSTGDPQRDHAIVTGLHGMTVGEPPPPRMPQPFTMVLLPLSSGGSMDCPLRQRVRNG